MRSILTAALVAGLFFADTTTPVTIEVIVERTGALVDGSFVGGLTRDDFVVAVDDVEVPIDDCVLDDGPVSVVVMVDITASTLWPGPRGDTWLENKLRDDLLAQFRKEDRVRFASVGRQVIMAGAFTTDWRLMRQGLIDAMAPRPEERTGPSPVWDALDAALSALEPEPGRRAVILLSDGKATANHKDLSEVADRAVALGIPVSTVNTGMGPMILAQASNQNALVRPGLAMERLSEATGGLAEMMASQEDIVLQSAGGLPSEARPLTKIVLSLRRVYRISVTTSHTDGQFHRLKVRTRDASHRVRTPAAFKAEPAPEMPTYPLSPR